MKSLTDDMRKIIELYECGKCHSTIKISVVKGVYGRATKAEVRCLNCKTSQNLHFMKGVDE